MTTVDPRPSAHAADGPRAELAPARRASHSRRDVVRAYVALTKPRIIELLLVTTVPVMFLAADGVPDLRLLLATLVGGMLAAGGANALNCFYDRDIDQVMVRTGHRPLVTGQVSPRGALVFGLTLSVVSVAWFALTTNLLSAALAAAAILAYAVGYTILLKRRTPQNIVWGGAAGCMQVLIGWTAVTGSLSWQPWVLFAVLFFWTPPHYWPLSLKFREDYAAAGVPMLPVVASQRRVSIEIVAYPSRSRTSRCCSPPSPPFPSPGSDRPWPRPASSARRRRARRRGLAGTLSRSAWSPASWCCSTSRS